MSFDVVQPLVLQENQVAIAISNGAFGCHLGIVYCVDAGAATLLHLAWHQKLIVQNYQETTTWLARVVALPMEVSEQLVALAYTVGEKYTLDNNGGIGYGINFYFCENAIDANATYGLQGDADGLTCATFVQAIFTRFYVPLINLSSWKPSPQNAAWGRAVVCFLEASETVEKKHIEAVAANVGSMRLRPEEVAAASEQFSAGSPATYEEVQERAGEIAQVVLAAFGPLEFPPETPYGICQSKFYEELATIKAAC